MSTPLSLIYRHFLKEVEDHSLARLDEEEFNDTLFAYLEKSATLEFVECTKDLDNVVGDRNYSQLLDTDGQTREFKISELPPYESIEIKVIADGEEMKNYFTIEGDSVNFDIAPTAFQEVYLTWSVIGCFEEDLTRTEIMILAKGMVMQWLNNQILREEKLESAIGDRDILVTSNATMLKQLTDLKKQVEKDLKRYKTRYSYSFDPEDFS